MTLDELIATATELRSEVGGEAPVFMMTPGGYASVVLTDSLGFADATGAGPTAIVLIAPDTVPAA